MDRLAPAAEALALACLGAVLLWLSLSGRYTFFVPPSARLGVLASGAGLLACALALSSRVGSAEASGGASARRAVTRALVALLASVLLALPFRVSPSELAASALGARPSQGQDAPAPEAEPEDPQSDTDAGGGSDPDASTTPHGGGADGATADGALTLTTEDFYAQVEELTSHGRAHDGQRIELVGFVMSEESARGQASIPRITSQESFAVARMAIWCCAADAYAVGFAVRWDGAAPAPDSWVRVSGTLRVRGSKALVIEADSVEETAAPNPEFIVQTR